MQWLAHTQGVDFMMPAAHPFNPLGLLRLAVASQHSGLPSRYVCETIFKHVWCTGLEAADAQRLSALAIQLGPERDPQSADVKQQLQTWTQEALTLDVFGVPSLVVDGQVFWGQDALPMLRAYLLGDEWFNGPGWHAVRQIPVGVRRQ